MLLDDVRREAAKLTPVERAELAAELLQSLEPAEDGAAEIEREWVIEAKRRLGEIDRGEVTPIPGDEVLAHVRRQLG